MLDGEVDGSWERAQIYIVDAEARGTVTSNSYRQDIGSVTFTCAPGTFHAAARLTSRVTLRADLTDQSRANNQGAIVLRDMTLMLAGKVSR